MLCLKHCTSLDLLHWSASRFTRIVQIEEATRGDVSEADVVAFDVLIFKQRPWSFEGECA